MSLYWYNLQNLGMGYYTLRFSGTGGVQISGYAAYRFKTNQDGPRTTVTVIPMPGVSKKTAKLYEEAIKMIARLESVTPLPDPSHGEIVAVAMATPSQNNAALQKTARKIKALQSTTPLPNPLPGMIESSAKHDYLTNNGPTARRGTILINANGKSTEEALDEAMRQIQKLQLSVGFIGIKEAK